MKNSIKRISIVILLVFLLAGNFSTAFLLMPANADNPRGKSEKIQPQRTIAIVYDNSKSMFKHNGSPIDAWCKAQYATEVFGTMMNDGDIMFVYPMWQVTTDDQIDKTKYQNITNDNYKTNLNDAPIPVHGPNEAKIVRKIYTYNPYGTPISTIENAYNGLINASGEEKWLIVLTDGKFADDSTDILNDVSSEFVANRLDEYAKDVQILYLQIGNDNPPVLSKGTVFRAKNSGEILESITQMCNFIFGRKEIKVSADKKLTVDIPIKKFFVFIQGDQISDIKLTDSKGKSYSASSSYEMKYSDRGAGNTCSDFIVDKSLQGAIAIFENCGIGGYSISCTGTAKSMAVYYEPDVFFHIEYTDGSGNVVDVTKEADPGEYYLSYGLAYEDPDTGETVMTDSSLLGEQKYEIDYTLNDDQKHISDDKPGKTKIDLNYDDTLEIDTASVSYLDNYRITYEGDDVGDFTLKCKPNPDDFILKITGGKSTYSIDAVETEGVYSVGASYNGVDLGASDYTLTATISGTDLSVAVTEDGSGYKISLEYVADPKDVKCGDYNITVKATYEYRSEIKEREKTITFTVDDIESFFELTIVPEQTNYSGHLGGEWKPIRVDFNANGNIPDSEIEEAIKNAIIEANPDLPFRVERIAGERAVNIIIDKDANIEKGDYTIKCSAELKDKLGRDLSSEAALEISISSWPCWFVWFFWILLIAAIAIIAVIIYRNMKVLPRNISLKLANVYQDGDLNDDPQARFPYVSYNLKKGTLSIGFPSYFYELQGEIVLLKLIPKDRRKIKSKNREAMVTSVTAPSSIYEIRIGSSFLLQSGNENAAESNNLPVSISDGDSVNICCVMPDSGDEIRYILNSRLSFE